MWYAWSLILGDEMTIGGFVAFTAYVGYLTGPMGRIAGLFSSIQQASISISRMFEYLDTSVEQDPTASYEPAPAIRTVLGGPISLRGVTCEYEPGRRVLDALDVVIPEGEVTAIVGASGAGKSTLLRLIPRLVEPSSGTVSIGSNDVRAISLSDLRRQVAVVWQEPFLVRGTLRENLLLGEASADPGRLDEVLHICQLDEMACQLPGGLDSPIAEWGASLSGGQRQRVALGRALMRDTRILLLDESMANIDAASEDIVLRKLLAFCRGRTVVLVTHRLSAAVRANRVCVMEHGRMVAAGEPSELTLTDAAFRRVMMSGTGGRVGVSSEGPVASAGREVVTRETRARAREGT